MARHGATVTARALADDERAELLALHAEAVAAGRNAAARTPAARVAWQALYDYVAVLTTRGRSGRQIAQALNVAPQRISQMLAMATSR